MTNVTYDPTIKQWVQDYMDNFGGYGISSSPGWQGNMLTWSSTGLDGTKVSDVATKVSDTETSDTVTTTDFDARRRSGETSSVSRKGASRCVASVSSVPSFAVR